MKYISLVSGICNFLCGISSGHYHPGSRIIRTMSIINLQKVTLHYGQQPLLDQVNLAIEPKERLGILGRNGMGKSTLLRVIMGETLPDSGEIFRQKSLVIAKLAQEVPLGLSGSVYDVVAEALGENGRLLSRYQHVSAQLAHDASPQCMQELHTLQQALDKHNAWNVSHKIDDVISRIGLTGVEEFAALSGGLKRRVLFGQAMAMQPDVLLLDEPTNHLDIETVDWLESYLNDFAGTVIFITHDRVFLQKIATRLLEIDRGNIQSYPGDYANYVLRKQHELEVESTHNQLFDKRLSQEEAWIRQGVKARRTRNEGRVRALEKLRAERSARREQTGKAAMQLQQAEQSGKLVIEAVNLSYQQPQGQLIHGFSTTIMRGDKIGIIGPNGCGKTTLLKMLLGELTPTEGSVRQGTQLTIAYFDQLRGQLDEEKTVADNVSYGDQYVTINGKSTHIMSYLQDFLFSPDRARTPVKALSGGERNRLLLARLFSKPANMLVMDEPTNDLDLETLELLEELLVEYQGTLLLVSHDRTFLNNVVTSTFVFEEDGKIQEYVGGYDDWLRQRAPVVAKVTSSSTTMTATPIKTTDKARTQPPKGLYALEQQIEKLERKQAELQLQLAASDIYQPENAALLLKLQTELQQVATALAEAVARWEAMVG